MIDEESFKTVKNRTNHKKNKHISPPSYQKVTGSLHDIAEQVLTCKHKPFNSRLTECLY